MLPFWLQTFTLTLQQLFNFSTMVIFFGVFQHFCLFLHQWQSEFCWTHAIILLCAQRRISQKQMFKKKNSEVCFGIFHFCIQLSKFYTLFLFLCSFVCSSKYFCHIYKSVEFYIWQHFVNNNTERPTSKLPCMHVMTNVFMSKAPFD